LAREQLPAFYHAADVFFLASRHETFGFAPLEAASAGLPLLLSDLPVFREVFGSEPGAAIYASEVEEFTQAILQIAGSAERRSHLSQMAQVVSKCYELDGLIHQVMSTYLGCRRSRYVPGS